MGRNKGAVEMKIWTQQPNSPSGAKVYHSGRFIKSVYGKTIFYNYVPKGRRMSVSNGHIIKVVKK